jgi:DNA invertase Pin-like site-specific DNA recombinase
MIYGYIRVSTEKQTLENQRYEIEQFCKHNNLSVDRWIEETTSGTKSPEKRLLGSLLQEVGEGDVIIATEISRFGRTLFMVMQILNHCLERGSRVWTIRDNYRLGDDIQSKVLAFAFGLSAEIERNFIAQRTKEALARKKEEGVVLGRKVGSKSSHLKLDGKEDRIVSMMRRGVSNMAIARKLNVNRGTLSKYINERGLKEIAKIGGLRPSIYFQAHGYDLTHLDEYRTKNSKS